MLHIASVMLNIFLERYMRIFKIQLSEDEKEKKNYTKMVSDLN